MEIIGYILSLLIGISLGIIGGGGSILTVPVLVYILGIDATLATTYSLFIVGATSFVGFVRYAQMRLVDYRLALYFGLPGMLLVYFTRAFLLPLLPHTIITLGNHSLSQSTFLMLIFAVIMLLAAVPMVRGKKANATISSSQSLENSKPAKLVGIGAAVGILTGLLGVGGGFLIIPALVLFGKVEMKKAVGTSLLIIAANSSFGFISNFNNYTIHWSFVLLFTSVAIAGLFLGIKLSGIISGEKLKPLFGWLIAIMAVVILVMEIIK